MALKLKTGFAGCIIAILCIGLCGCMHAQSNGQNDPFEPVNRAVFAFNTVADRTVIEPAAKAYQTVTPKPARKGIRNFIDNLKSPVVLANDLLQGKWKRAGETAARLVINTTIGIGGVLDVAKSVGIEKHKEDLGQTLASKGVPPGPYLVLPLLGPSNVRDLAGMFVEETLVPNRIASIKGEKTFDQVRRAVDVVDLRASMLNQIDTLREEAVDEYVSVRSYYRQLRKNAIADGVVDMDDLPDFDTDFDTDFDPDFDIKDS